MTRINLVVAALLLTNLAGIAAAADIPEHNSKNAQRLIATLDSVGINAKEVRNFITEADTHVDHGYLYLAQQNSLDGKVSLRYQIDTKMGIRKLQLNYTPKDSHFQVTAATNSLMCNYRFQFDTK